MFEDCKIPWYRLLYYKWIRYYNFFRYKIPYGISNLIHWFPIIWSDRDWDHVYLFIIMKRKLEQMRICILNGYHANKEKDAHRIKIAINLLDRLIKDEYHEMAFKEHDKKWGNMRAWCEPLPDNKTGDIGEECRMIFHRPNAPTNALGEQERKEFRKCLEYENFLHRQDVDFLMKIMAKYIRTWWS